MGNKKRMWNIKIYDSYFNQNEKSFFLIVDWTNKKQKLHKYIIENFLLTFKLRFVY